MTIEITYGVGTRVLLDGSAVFSSSVNLTDNNSDLLVAVGPYQTQAGVSARVTYDNVVARDLP